MIKTFIFVEDGSVDLDELKSSVGDDVLVISYRQGATAPAIQQPREPVSRREVNIKDRLLDLMIEFDEMGFSRRCLRRKRHLLLQQQRKHAVLPSCGGKARP